MAYVLIALLIVMALRESSRNTKLQLRLDQMEVQLKLLMEKVSGLQNPPVPEPLPEEIEELPDIPVGPQDDDGIIAQVPEPIPASIASSPTAEYTPVNSSNQLAENIQKNWMVWLGGFCVALAGIFLAKYSIERGLFGPTARIGLGVITGLALHGAAEWLRRKTGESNPSFAALAGGGSITLFAILLAALHFYQMISPGTAFVLLAIIALATMVLSLKHGPALAAIGLLGAYTVPIFVSTGSGAIRFAMSYALVITIAGLFLLRYVYRNWLWRGILAGALAWWAISLSFPYIVMEQGWYLAAVAYSLLAIPGFNWLLRQGSTLPDTQASTLIYQLSGHKLAGSAEAEEWQLRIGLYILIAAQAFTILIQTHLSAAIYAWTPLLMVLLLAARNRESLTILPWVLIVVEILAIGLSQISSVDARIEIQKLSGVSAVDLTQFAALSSFVIVGFGWINLQATRFKGIWSSFITVAPLLLLTLTFFLTTDILDKFQWASLTAVLAASYMFIAGILQKKPSSKQLVVWLIFAAHFLASLTAVILTQDGRLTLAIALQVVSTAWIIQYFKIPEIGWLLKVLVGIVVVRLTINPAMLSYTQDTHWTLLTFGGSTLCCVVAMKLLRSFPSLEKWAEGAALHLFVLFLWAELRYWLHDGELFAGSITLLEAGLSMIMFGALSIVYHRRSLVSQHLQSLYVLFSYILIGLALCYYAIILLATLSESAWLWENIGQTPIFNRLLLCFGSPVILGALTWRYHSIKFKNIALLFTGAATFIFINLQIKHLWQGDVRLYESMQSGELYTYSAVWLAIAIALILGGALRSEKLGQQVYRAGLALLGLVIAKLFLVDMSDLDGLLRVASFMGLGLSLLGISYLHQRIQASRSETAET